MALQDSLGTILGIGVVAGLGYLWYSYLGGQQALARLVGGSSGATNYACQRSWLCGAFGVGCPDPAACTNANNTAYANSLTTSPSQAAAGESLDEQILAQLQAGDYQTWDGIYITPLGTESQVTGTGI